MPLVSELQELYPSNCPVLNEVRAEHAGWNYTMDYGYICYNKNCVKILEHRLVAERAHGLQPEQVVHHRDECITNNAADNVLPMSRKMHNWVHRPKRIILTCPVCKKRFHRKKSEAAKTENNYCSAECSSKSQRRVERPSKEQLLKLMVEVNNWLELGRMFGVSDNTVRKWARRYKLDLSVCNGWNRSSFRVPTGD